MTLKPEYLCAEVELPDWMRTAMAAAVREGRRDLPEGERDLPTVPGWYWFRADYTRAESLPHVVHVHPHPLDGVLCVPLKTLHLVRLIEELPMCRPNAVWFGPLEVPQ